MYAYTSILKVYDYIILQIFYAATYVNLPYFVCGNVVKYCILTSFLGLFVVVRLVPKRYIVQ